LTLFFLVTEKASNLLKICSRTYPQKVIFWNKWC